MNDMFMPAGPSSHRNQQLDDAVIYIKTNHPASHLLDELDNRLDCVGTILKQVEAAHYEGKSALDANEVMMLVFSARTFLSDASSILEAAKEQAYKQEKINAN